MKDIKDLQWSAVTEKTFHQLFELLKIKYEDQGAQVQAFLEYVEEVLITSKENQCFEGAQPYGCSNNQGLEGRITTKAKEYLPVSSSFSVSRNYSSR